MGVVNGILLARLLGPAVKGDYYFLVLLPATALVLLQLGLPQAFGFFVARGRAATILAKAFVLTILLSIVGFAGVAALFTLTRNATLESVGLPHVIFAFVGFPLALNATFTTAIVMGRQAVRWFAAVNTATSIAGTVLLVAILGGLGPSLTGALAVYVISNAIQSVGFAIGAMRVAAAQQEPTERVSYRELVEQGLPFYPGSLAIFFNYRVDVYLIAFLIADAAVPLGYYSMAVGLAELAFFLPRAVSTLFFPHVAGSQRDDSDRQVALVARVTMLVTAASAALIVPAAILVFWLLLPAFWPSLVPLLVLLPGVVVLSVTYVLSGYFRGIGRPGITSTVNIVSLAANVVVNLILIPPFGIVGASAASLVSYSLTSLALTAFAARVTGTQFVDFWVPRTSDLRYLAAEIGAILRQSAGRWLPAPKDREVRPS